MKKLPLEKLHFFLSLLTIGLFGFLCSQLVKASPIFEGEAKEILGFKELLPSPFPYPVAKGTAKLPELSAKSVVVLDIGSSVLLYQKDPETKLLPASTTKIMTALVALENYPLGEVLTIKDSQTEGNTVKLTAGERLTVENLLFGLLIGSGNDAALALAENFPGGTPGFVAAMNEKATALKLSNTHFTNPAGFDESDHYSTAGDLAVLTAIAIKNPTFSRVVSQPEITITDVSGQIVHKLKNTNELVGKIDGVKGVKTGWTKDAGECLVSLVERNREKVIIVLLGSKDRFGETKALIDWVFNNFEWKIISPASSR